MSTGVRDRAFKLYRAPFRFERGYIWDADNEMVADDHVGDAAEINPDVAPAARVRGWGRIGYLPEAEATQDAVGALFAEALTKLWREHFKRPAIVDGGAPLTTKPATSEHRPSCTRDDDHRGLCEQEIPAPPLTCETWTVWDEERLGVFEAAAACAALTDEGRVTWAALRARKARLDTCARGSGTPPSLTERDEVNSAMLLAIAVLMKPASMWHEQETPAWDLLDARMALIKAQHRLAVSAPPPTPPLTEDCAPCRGSGRTVCGLCPEHGTHRCTACSGTGKRDTGTPTPLTCICPFPRTRCPHCTWPCEACRAEERKGINDRDTGTPPGAGKRWPPQEGDEWRDVSGKPWVFSGKSAFTEWWASHEGKGFEWRTWRESDTTNGAIAFARRGGGTPPGARVPPEKGDVWRFRERVEWTFDGAVNAADGARRATRGVRKTWWKLAAFTDGTLVFVRRGTPGAGGS